MRLTRHGYRRVRRFVTLDEPMLREFEAEVVWGKNTVDIDAAAVAWKHVQGLLYKSTFGPRGGVKRQNDFVALRRITRELNYLESHPAMHGLAMLEWQPDIFPVWKQEPDEQGRIYTPYPRPGHQFVILAPEWEKVPGEPRTTRWLERKSAPGRLGDEAVHLRLQRHPVL